MIINTQINETLENQLNLSLLEKAAEAALRQQNADENSELTIVVENDDAVHELNKEYLGIDAPTDVLSFPADEIDPDTGNRYLGDIILSLPKAKSQAEIGGHAVEAEAQLLVVHGVLHLLGMDHAEPEEKAAMWGIQKDILDQLNVHLSRLPEE